MAVPSGVLKHKYPGNGVADEFDYDFKIISKDVVKVQLQNGTSEPTDLTVDIHFSITGIGDDNGGTIKYPITGTKMQTGQYLIIKPNYPYTQDLELDPGTVPAKPIERQFDIQAMQIKQIADELSRALQVSEAYDGDADSFIALITSTSSQILASISGTSVSAVTVGSGSKSFTTQSGKTWVLGQRLRVASDDGSKIMEGPVTAYTGTTLTINVDFTAGSGSHNDWNISLTGERGASGPGSGDMLASNNLSELTNKALAFATIKQQADSTTTGVSRFATAVEALAGVLNNVALAPDVFLPLSLGVMLAKGDIVSHNGTSPGRLAVGTNGFGLLADSSQPFGIKWGSVLSNIVPLPMITSSQTYTPTAGMKFVLGIAQAPGGGGASVNIGGASTGLGGGAGELCIGIYTAADIGASKAVTIGSAGTGGSINNNGTDGGDVSLGSLLVAKGGKGGAKNQVVNDPQSTTVTAGGGPGTANILKVPGQPSDMGMFFGSATEYWCSLGGKAVFGHPGRPARVSGTSTWEVGASGQTGYGCGGPGGSPDGPGEQRPGKSGGPGFLLLIEFF